MRANTKDGWVEYPTFDDLTFFSLQPEKHRVMEVPLSLFYRSPLPEREPHYQVVVAYRSVSINPPGANTLVGRVKFQALEVSTNGGPGVQRALRRFKP